MLHRSFLALIASTAIVTPAVAQDVQVWETRPAPAPTAMAWGRVSASQRAVIGVTVSMRPSSGDSLGATLAAVTPGGPAARAGLLAGDIITKFNGTALATRGSASDVDGQSGPGLRLVELVARVESGDTVAIEWRHERQRKTAKVVTEAAVTDAVVTGDMNGRIYTVAPRGGYRIQLDPPDRERATLELTQRLDAMRPMMPGFGGGQVFFRVGGPLGGVQFAPINADLGRYFGVTEGILVLETPDSSLHIDLKGGDVIVAVGDRKPSSVERLFAILGSYEDEENINFDVMRDKRHVTVTVKAEEIRGGGRLKMMEPDLAPPMRTPMPDAPPPASRPRSRSGT